MLFEYNDYCCHPLKLLIMNQEVTLFSTRRYIFDFDKLHLYFFQRPCIIGFRVSHSIRKYNSSIVPYL